MSLAAFIPILGPAFEKLLACIPDPNERIRREAEFQRSLLEALTAESADNRAINKVEASHSSIFVSGWRPFIGWICGCALAFQYLVRPFWIWVAATWWPGSPVPPTLDGMLWELVMGMLGLGGLHTIEKWKRSAR